VRVINNGASSLAEPPFQGSSHFKVGSTINDLSWDYTPTRYSQHEFAQKSSLNQWIALPSGGYSFQVDVYAPDDVLRISAVSHLPLKVIACLEEDIESHESSGGSALRPICGQQNNIVRQLYQTYGNSQNYGVGHHFEVSPKNGPYDNEVLLEIFYRIDVQDLVVGPLPTLPLPYHAYPSHGALTVCQPSG